MGVFLCAGVYPFSAFIINDETLYLRRVNSYEKQILLSENSLSCSNDPCKCREEMKG